ncbi:hypothetical protein BDV12DRAFT_191504 [Aspergillus spectabilis]
MAHSDPDERLVYLACQHIFRGPNSMVRKRKQVMSLIQRNQPALTDILREYNIDRTCNIAKSLLDDEIFHSNLRAKIRFPELFDVSPARSSKDIIIKSQTQPTIEEKEELAASKTRIGTDNSTPSLYPVYIHYRSQHIITTSIQRLLLVKHGWDCPEAVELTEWIKFLSQYSCELVTTKKPLDELFSNLCALRHSAVHRLRKTAVGVERLAENAQLFLETLDEVDRAERVSRLRRELKTAIEELQRNKDLLEGRYFAEIKEIQNERAALDRRLPTKEVGKGKERIPEECPELSNSDEELVESVVAVNGDDCPSEHL